MVNLASAHVKSLNFGPDTGTVSCQFQQATGKSTMPSISKWSPVIICICLCRIPYCSFDWEHIAVCDWVEHVVRNRILHSFPPGLVWSGPYPLVPWSARYREGITGRERGFVTHSQTVREIEREGSFLFFSGWVDMGRGPVAFLGEYCWRNENMQLLSDVTWKRKAKMGSLALFQVLAALASICDGFSVSESKCWFPPVIKKWRIFSS